MPTSEYGVEVFSYGKLCAASEASRLILGSIREPRCPVVRETADALETVSWLQCELCPALLAVAHNGDWLEARWAEDRSLGTCSLPLLDGQAIADGLQNPM
jgi:hypothetical protein